MTVDEIRNAWTKAIRELHFWHYRAMDEGHEGKHPECTTFSYDLLDGETCCACEAPPITVGDVSDGYHSFNELYDHRITLFLALCNAEGFKPSGNPVWRSKLHSDGSAFDGWFILGIGQEPGEQITYHLPMSRWDEAGFAETRERAPTFDGHTSADVLMRLRRYYE